VISSQRKDESKRITSVIISELFTLENVIYFFDEWTFSMNDFKGKQWVHPDNLTPIHLRNPNLRLKLNVLIAKDRLVTFHLVFGRRKKDDVVDLLRAMVTNKVARDKRGLFKYVVLDNNPKNRSGMLQEITTKNSFGLVFIIPGTPEQNMADIFFLFVKHEYAKFNNLALVNETRSGRFAALRLVFEAVQSVLTIKFGNIRQLIKH
jgi:hypothetical protein